MTVLLLLQIFVPLVLLAGLALGRASSRATWGLRVGLTLAYLVAIGSAGLWLAVPRPALWVLAAALPLAAVTGYRRRRAQRPPGRGYGRLAGLAALATLTVATAGVAAFTLVGRTPPAGPAVTLPLPLRGGTYYVANGGSSRILNAHLSIPDSARERFRGQLLGIDLVRVDRLGRRARGGPAPADPRAYLAFGDTVFAPCDGRVVGAADGLADLTPPTVDREHMEGNHVRLECLLRLQGDTTAAPAPVWILLAHLQRGSVRVTPGERVEAGRPVGRVGNTGNSAEPHLHVHAQRPGTAAAPNSGEPIPLRLAGRYLARNDRVAAPRTPDGYPDGERP